MADQYIFETAVSDGAPEHTPFVKKDWIYINDNNGGQYSGTIQFDTAVACNSGKWVNWQEAYLMIPFTIISKANINISGAANAYMAGLRNGSHQLINNLSVSYNGTTIVQQQNLLNHYVSYKLMTTYSQDDLVKNGPSTQFYPDNSAFRWSQLGATKDGNGISNNRLSGGVNGTSLATLGTLPDQVNAGAYQRAKQVLDFSSLGGAAAANCNGLLSSDATGVQLLTSANAATLGRARFTDSGSTADATRKYYWDIMCKIPLRCLSDFFAQCPPLLKGALLQINIGYNASSQTIDYNSTGTVVTLASAVTMTGLTNPLIVHSAAANQPNASTFGSATSQQTFACGVVSATEANGNSRTNGILSVCRMYLPTYVLSPTAEEMLLKLHPTRTIQYQDLYQYTVSSVAAGASFSQLLSSSIVNPKSIVIMPYIAKSALPGYLASNPVYCSPFTTEGATTSPLLGISNLAIQVSGTNVWNANQTYDFEAFNNELQSINAINGNKMWGITSGLISETDYYFGYRYYVCDLQKRLASEDLVPKSITISGVNSSNVVVDYVVFISYGRQCQVETLTGALLQ